jgi:hypothetical protein
MTKQQDWLKRVNADMEANDNIQKVAAVLSRIWGLMEGDDEFTIGGADEYADEVIAEEAKVKPGTAGAAVKWLESHGYLEICGHTIDSSGSQLEVRFLSLPMERQNQT